MASPIRHPLRAGGFVDDAVELQEPPNEDEQPAVARAVPAVQNMALFLFDRFCRGLAKLWLYSLASIDAFLDYVVKVPVIRRTLRVMNAYFLVKVRACPQLRSGTVITLDVQILCISLLLLLLGTFNLSAKFFSLGSYLLQTVRSGDTDQVRLWVLVPYVYTAMLRTNPSQLSSGVGPVIISFALVWNFRFILTHVRGVLSELMGTSAQLPSWHKALTHHTRRSVVSTYLALSAGTCAYLARHWWFGPVTSWQDWRKSYGTCVPSPGVWQPHRLTWACPSSCLPGVGIKTCAYGVLGTVDPVAYVCVPTS